MKKRKVLIKAFGLTEYDQIDFPRKISNSQIARLIFGDIMGCSRCFPHGLETLNATIAKNKKCWKNYRKKQYRVKKEELQ